MQSLATLKCRSFAEAFPLKGLGKTKINVTVHPSGTFFLWKEGGGNVHNLVLNLQQPVQFSRGDQGFSSGRYMDTGNQHLVLLSHRGQSPFESGPPS